MVYKDEPGSCQIQWIVPSRVCRPQRNAGANPPSARFDAKAAVPTGCRVVTFRSSPIFALLLNV